MDASGDFDTGLTIKVSRNVPAKTGKRPSQHAADFIRFAGDELRTLEAPWSNSRSPYESHGALYQTTDPLKGDFNAHMLALANDSTGTVYFCIFEGPAAEWDQIWPIGQMMLEKLAINSGF